MLGSFTDVDAEGALMLLTLVEEAPFIGERLFRANCLREVDIFFLNDEEEIKYTKMNFF